MCAILKKDKLKNKKEEDFYTLIAKLNKKGNRDLIHYFDKYSKVYNSISFFMWKEIYKKGGKLTLKEISYNNKLLGLKYNISQKEVRSAYNRAEYFYLKMLGGLKYRVKCFKEKIKLQENRVNQLKNKVNTVKSKILNKEAVDLPKYRGLKSRLYNSQVRLNTLKNRIKRFEKQINTGMVKCCFGSKKLFNSQYYLKEKGFVNHEQWLAKWRERRNNTVYYEGGKRDARSNFIVKLITKKEVTDKASGEFMSKNYLNSKKGKLVRSRSYFYNFKNNRKDMFCIQVRVGDFYNTLKTNYDKNIIKNKYVYGECYFGYERLKNELLNVLNSSIKYRRVYSYCEKLKIKGSCMKGLLHYGYTPEDINTSPIHYIFVKRNGTWFIEVVFKVHKKFKRDFVTTTFGGTVGLDFNVGFIQLGETNESGNLIRLKRYDFKNQGKSKTKQDYDMSRVVSDIVKYCKESGKSLVIENLKCFNKRNKILKEYVKVKKVINNKLISTFDTKRYTNTIEAICKNNLIELIKVPSAYTTKIAEEKYCSKRKLNPHQGASYVIARRGQGFLDYYQNKVAFRVCRKTGEYVRFEKKVV